MVTIVGYNNNGFIIRNSWGRQWAYNGYSVYKYNNLVRTNKITPSKSKSPNINKRNGQLNVNIRIYDPYFISENIFGIDSETNLIDALSNSDGVILVTPHKEFHDIKPKFLKSKLRNPIFIDTRCVLDQHEAINAGLIYRGLGRGKL